MRTTAQAFHPMRGHVEDGCVVAFSNGRELTIKNVSSGWVLVDAAGKEASRRADGAFDLTTVIVQMEAA